MSADIDQTAEREDPFVIEPHPEFETLTLAELHADLKRIDERVDFGKQHGASQDWLTWMLQERRSCEAELKRRTQQGSKQGSFWPELIGAKDLLALPPDPTRWLWDQTLPFGGGSVLVAKPKSGKSTVAANLSIAIARGLPFLRRNTVQCPVAYLSLDASTPEITETFLQFGLRETDPIFIHAGAAPGDAMPWLVQSIAKVGARFVVVDTIQRLFRFENLNDYSEVTNTIEPLLDAIREQNAHVLFLHHAKKNAGDDLDSAIGSTAIRGLAYAYLHLKRLPDSERRILRSDQRGGKNMPELHVGFDRATGWLEVKGSMEDAEIADVEPRILEFIESEGDEVSEKVIRAAMQPMRAIIVSKAVRQLLKNGRLERTGRGRKGSPFLYSLAASLGSIPDSILKESIIGGDNPGIESEKQQKSLANNTKILFPKSQELNGNGKEQNPKTDSPGTESDREGWELIS